MLVGHFAISLLSPITESFQSFFFSCILKYTTVMCCGVSLIFFFSWLLVSVNNGHQFWEFSSIYFLSLISVLGQLFFFFLLGELFFSFNLLALFVMNFSRKFLFEHTIKFNFGVCVCVCVYAGMLDACRGQKRSPELKFWIIVRYHVGPGNWTQAFWKNLLFNSSTNSLACLFEKSTHYKALACLESHRAIYLLELGLKAFTIMPG